MRDLFAPPAGPHQAVDVGHLAERFGRFLIILLGELVVTVGGAALERPTDDVGYWLVLICGLVLAGALWWAYFAAAAAEINRILLHASGGNPALAYLLYAGGHLTPAFSLLLVAAGVGLSFQEHPPGTAAWLMTVGLAVYLGGTRVFSAGSRRWYAAPAWAVVCAAAVTALRQGTLRRLLAGPIAFLRSGS